MTVISNLCIFAESFFKTNVWERDLYLKKEEIEGKQCLKTLPKVTQAMSEWAGILPGPSDSKPQVLARSSSNGWPTRK